MSNKRNFNKHRNGNNYRRNNYNGQPRSQNHSGQNPNGPNQSEQQTTSPEEKSEEKTQPIMNKPQENRPKNPNFRDDRKHRDDRRNNDRPKQFNSEKKNSKEENDEVVFPRKTNGSWAFASTSPKGFEHRKKVGSFDQLQDRRVRSGYFGDDDIWGADESLLDDIREDLRLDLPPLDTISDLNGLALQMNSMDYSEILSRSDEEFHPTASLDFSDD